MMKKLISKTMVNAIVFLLVYSNSIYQFTPLQTISSVKADDTTEVSSDTAATTDPAADSWPANAAASSATAVSTVPTTAAPVTKYKTYTVVVGKAAQIAGISDVGSYSSVDSETAMVSPTGNIIGNKPGTTQILVRNNRNILTYIFTVHVKNSTTTNKESLSFGQHCTVGHKNASKFISSDPSVLSLSYSDTGLGKGIFQTKSTGSALVTLKNSYGGILGYSKITVKPSKVNLPLKVGCTMTYHTDYVQKYISSNSNMVTVSKNTLTAVSPGTTTVYGRDASNRALVIYHVKVTNNNQSFGSSNLIVGQKTKLKTTGAYFFSSDNIKIAAADVTSGAITANSPGTTVVSLQTAQGGIIGTYTFFVKNNQEISGNYSILNGNTVTLFNDSASYYSSSNPNIASVDGTSLHGGETGTATIHVHNGYGGIYKNINVIVH